MSEAADFHEIIFDAVPSPLFIVDGAMGIIDFNLAAAKLSAPVITEALRPPVGDVLSCANASEAGCGNAPECRSCVVRRSVRAAFDGGRVCRRAAPMTVCDHGTPGNLEFLVTTTAFQDGEERLVLLIMEDVTELKALRQSVETYVG